MFRRYRRGYGVLKGRDGCLEGMVTGYRVSLVVCTVRELRGVWGYGCLGLHLRAKGCLGVWVSGGMGVWVCTLRSSDVGNSLKS